MQKLKLKPKQIQREVYTGSSGYDYQWEHRGKHHVFYETTEKNRLEYYAKFLNFVELNCTFYKLPTQNAVISWYNKTPKNFKFLLKFSQYITHSTRFRSFNQGYDKFMTPVTHLKEKLQGLLFQFPENFRLTTENMELFRNADKYMNESSFIKPNIYIELRSMDWFTSEGIELLKELKWILVNTSNYFGFMPVNLTITRPDHIMFRMHGPNEHCMGSYSDEQLISLASAIYNINSIVVTFNNTDTLQHQLYVPQLHGEPNRTLIYIPNDKLINTPDSIHNAITIYKALV